jgi:hypothetical protein
MRVERADNFHRSMFLKNYTSTVPVSDSLYRIEKVLIRCGVSGISKEYGLPPESKVIAVMFNIALDGQRVFTVRLPANEEQAIEALWLDYVGLDKHDGKRVVGYPACNRKKKCREDFRQQGERTAWKIVQDWVEVQLSMIQMRQADFRQVFLPYAWDGKQTFFDRIKNGNFLALQAPKETPQ